MIIRADNGSGGTTSYMTIDGSDEVVRVHKPLWIDEYIVHIGDDNTYFGFSAADTFVVHAGATGHAELTITGTTATFAGTLASGAITSTSNIESRDTFILNYNNAGNKWQQLFDGSNGWNLRYNNGSSWSSNYVNVNTSGNATFAGNITSTAGYIQAHANSDTTPGFRMQSNDNHGWEFLHRATEGDFALNRETGGTTTEVLRISRSNGNATFAGKVNINQAADDQGLQINGYDDHSGSNVTLRVNSAGHTTLSQTTDGSSGYLFLSAENYLNLSAGTLIYTSSQFRIYDAGSLTFGNSGDFAASYNSSADEFRLMEGTSGSKGLKMDTDGKVTFTEDATFAGSVTATGGLIVDGQFTYDTDTGNQPFYITRQGSNAESLSIKVMDNNVRFESIQDETADNYGGFDFRMDGGTTEPDFMIRKGTGSVLFNVKGDGAATFANSIDLTAGQLKLRGDSALDHDGNSLYIKAPQRIYLYPGNANKGNIDTAGLLTIVGGGTFGGKITGTELEGTSLDINGAADISGGLSGNSSYQTGTVSVAQPILSKFLLAHSTESNSALVHPYFFNDLANFVNRGGTVTYGGLSANPNADETNRMFMASAWTCNAANSEITGSTWTIELKDFPRSLTYGTRFGISFGSISFSPSSIVIEYSTDNGSNYTTALTSSVRSEYYHTFVGNGGTGINAIKFTLGKSTVADPRVMNIYAYNYDSRGMTEYFLDKAGGTLYGALAMGNNNITGGGTITGTTLTGTSLDINGVGNVSGILSVASKLYLEANTSQIQVGANWNTGVLQFLNGPTTAVEFDIPNGRIKNNLGRYLTASGGNNNHFGSFDNYSMSLVTNNTPRLTINNAGNATFTGTVTAATTFIADAVDGTNNDPGADNVRFSGYGMIGNRDQLYITNVGNKLVFGVGGTHNAQNKLIISGSTSAFYNNITSTGTITGTTLTGTTLYGNHADGNGSSLKLGRADSSNYWEFNHAGGDLRIYNNASSGSHILLGINAGGTVKANNVGIGTATPDQKLHVVGNLNLDGNADISGNLSGVDTYTGQNIALTIGASGSGRRDPFTALHTSNNTITISQFGQSHAASPAANQIGVSNAEQHLHLITDSSANMQAGTSTKGIFLRSGGNVGIGTKSPGAKLDVAGEVQATSLDINGNADISGNLAIGGSVTSNTTFTADVYVHHNDGLQIGDTGNSSTARTTLTSFASSGNSQMKIKGGNFLHQVHFETSKNDFRYANLTASYNGGTSQLNLYQSNSDTTGTAATTTISTGTSTFAGNVTVGSNSLTAGSLDINGNADISGNLAVDGIANLDNTDIDGTFNATGTTFDVNSSTSLTLDNTNTTNGVKINTATSGSPVTIGHTTSEVVIADNLTVNGDLTTKGATILESTTNTTIKDRVVQINDGVTGDNTNDAGLMINRGDLDNVFFGWDESADKFVLISTHYWCGCRRCSFRRYGR